MAFKIDEVSHHRQTLCRAVTGYGHSSQIPWLQRCQQSAAHWPEGVGLCGTHYNTGFRRALEVIRPLRQLDEGDL
jgi:hypothetical protein